MQDSPLIWTFLPHRGVLKIWGQDSLSFLQGIMTQGLHPSHTQRVCFSLFLSPQGRCLFDTTLIQWSEKEYWLEMDANQIPQMIQHLSRYKLRSAVEWSLLPSHTHPVGVIFPPSFLLSQGNIQKDIKEESLSFVSLPQSEFCHMYSIENLEKDFGYEKQGVVWQDPRTSALGWRFIGPMPPFADTRTIQERDSAFKLPPLSPLTFQEFRYSLGVPEGEKELHNALPLEQGMNALNALDWQKGCYIGQEVTARMRYRSLVRKHLVPLKSAEGGLESLTLHGVDHINPEDTKESQDSALPPLSLDWEGQSVGHWRVGQGHYGLAMLRPEKIPVPLSSPFFCEGKALVLQQPQWMRTIPVLEKIMDPVSLSASLNSSFDDQEFLSCQTSRR